MFLVSSNAIKQTIQVFDIVIMQNSKWPPWNRHSDHIFVNNWDRDEVISPNHMFSLSRKWNESGFRPPLCTYRLNWARRTSWGWWDDWDDTVLQTQDSKFEPWRSEAEHATSRSQRLPTILTFTRGWGRNIFVSFKPPRPGTEPRTLAWKAAVLTTTLGPPPSLSRNAIKQTLPSLDIIIMQIQNGHHEISKLIIFALIIGIKRYFISHYYHAKFKMAAMKSLIIALILFHQISCYRYNVYAIQLIIQDGRHEPNEFITYNDKDWIFSSNHMLSASIIQ